MGLNHPETTSPRFNFHHLPDGTGETVVEITTFGDGGHYLIECYQYYNSAGVCRLEITQPLDRTSLFQNDKPLISLSFVEGEGSLTGYDPG